jgi:tRNA1Val (adenine37-N6)-methyltransferase
LTRQQLSSMGSDAGTFTTDTLLRGRVTLLQPARGFRSSLDPILLAAFVTPRFGRFVDIGCGTGALSFLLAAIDERATGVAVEIQPRLASLAGTGVVRNGFAHRIQVLQADARSACGQPPLGRGGFDLVVTNPPYRAISDGVQSPDPERAQANHEVTLALDDWLDVAAALVRPAGRVAVVYPAARVADLVSGLERRGLAPARLRFCHPRLDRPASRVLVEAAGAASATALRLPPLILHEPDGRYSAEVRAMLGDLVPRPGEARSSDGAAPSAE